MDIQKLKEVLKLSIEGTYSITDYYKDIATESMDSNGNDFFETILNDLEYSLEHCPMYPFSKKVNLYLWGKSEEIIILKADLFVLENNGDYSNSSKLHKQREELI